MSENGLNRASRASRGKRMAKLLDEEADADDEFWSQDAFKDDAEDNEYAGEDEEADVFDSDFDDDEPNEEEDVEEDERQPVKKRKLLLGTSQDKKKKDKKAKKDKKSKKDKDEKKEKKGAPLHREGTDPAGLGGDGVVSHSVASPSDLAQTSHQQENGEAAVDVDGERSVRKSTRTAVVIKQAEREAHQAALQALSKPVKKKKEEERKISQEEMLLEAAQTEIQNLQALEIMLAREEEVKHKAIIQKSVYTGPQIRFHSQNGTNVLEFTKVSEFPSEFNSRPTPYPKKAVCFVTGLPAKYRDPKSGLPYATKEAFKIIRERYNKGDNPRRKDPVEESHQRKRTKVERERSGSGGRTIVTKLKYKKVTNDSISNDDMGTASHPSPSTSTPPFSKPRDLDDVQNVQRQSTKPLPFQDQLDISRSETGIGGGSQLPKSLMSYDFQSLDMPSDDFVEANEADFMLDDLEVSLPSDLESGLSLPTSMAMSPMLLEHDDSRGDVAGDELEKGTSDVNIVPDEQQNPSLFSMPMLQLPDLERLGGGPSAGKDIL